MLLDLLWFGPTCQIFWCFRLQVEVSADNKRPIRLRSLYLLGTFLSDLHAIACAQFRESENLFQFLSTSRLFWCCTGIRLLRRQDRQCRLPSSHVASTNEVSASCKNSVLLGGAPIDFRNGFAFRLTDIEHIDRFEEDARLSSHLPYRCKYRAQG